MPICRQPATANAVKVYYWPQTLCGEIAPDAEWTRLRFTGGAPNVSADTIQSAELDGSAEITNVRLGSKTPAFDNSVELYYGAHDDLLEGAMQSNWQSGTTLPSNTVTVTAATKTVVVPGVDLTGDINVNGLIKLPGLTGYNAEPQLVTDISFSTDTTITLGAAREANALYGITGLEDESGTSDIVTNDFLVVGTSRQKFAFLFEYGDVVNAPQYELVMDAEVTGFNFNVAVNAAVTGSLNVIGVAHVADFTDIQPGWTFVEPANNEPFTGVDGCVIKNGSPFLGSTTADMTLDRGASAAFELCSDMPAHISYDKANNSVALTTFVYDLDQEVDYRGEVVGDYTIVCTLDGQAMAFHYPNGKITTLDKDISTGDITRNSTLQAYKPIGAASSLIIRRIQ